MRGNHLIHHRFPDQKICHRAAAGDAPDVSLVGDLIARLKPQKPIVCSMPALGNRTIKYIRAQHQNVIICAVKLRQYTKLGPLLAETRLDLTSGRPYHVHPGV